MKEVKEFMVDIHTHVLSNIDDGAKDLATSLALLKMAAESGTTDIIATPHVIEGAEHPEWQVIKQKTEDLNRNAQKAGIPIRVYAGAELEMNWDIIGLLKAGEEDYCLAGSRYVLIELPATSVPNYAEELLYEVQTKDLIPVIAHPERHPKLAKHPEILHQWVKNGALVQCNLGSVAGKFGHGAKDYIDLLLKNNMVHFFGTDAHNIEHRHTDTRAAMEILTKKVPPKTLDCITCTNPENIIKDSFFDAYIPKEFKSTEKQNKGLWTRLFG